VNIREQQTKKMTSEWMVNGKRRHTGQQVEQQNASSSYHRCFDNEIANRFSLNHCTNRTPSLGPSIRASQHWADKAVIFGVVVLTNN
jgi:hypothetical protein